MVETAGVKKIDAWTVWIYLFSYVYVYILFTDFKIT